MVDLGFDNFGTYMNSSETIEKLKDLKIRRNKNISWFTFSTDEIKTINAALYVVDENSSIRTMINMDGILEISIENYSFQDESLI